MAHELPSYFPHVSVCIDEVLNLLGYSQSNRERKRKCTTMSEVLSNIFRCSVTLYKFGSRSDGSTLHVLQSDSDNLYQANVYNVVTDVSECVQRKVNLLMVQDDDTHPGYVKLQHVDLTRPHHSIPVRNCFCKDSVLDGGQKVVFPNALLKLKFRRLGEQTNGPAETEIANGTGTSIDNVPAMRCYRWPAEEELFFTPRRCHSWPTAEQLRHIKNYGCFLVPIGHPFSNEQHLEWRLSFSIGERDLTRSLNDTMMKVFLVLKIIKKTFIKPVIGDNFSSYHCKVCIFWVRERTCEEIWRRENILLCLSVCLEQLLEWAKLGYCPDFFNVRNNIYDRKIIGNVSLQLVRILETLLYNKCEYLLCIQLGSIGNLLSLRITSGYFIQPIHWLTQYIYYIYTLGEAEDDYLNVYSSNRNLHLDIMLVSEKNGWIYIYWTINTVLSAARNDPHIKRDALNCALPALYAHLTYQVASLFIKEKHNMNAERKSMTLNTMSWCIARGLDCDSVSCRLKIAGFFYQMGRLDFAEICLQWVLDRFNDTVFNMPILGDIGETSSYHSVTMERILSKNPDLQTFFRDYVALSVVYSLSEIPITPAPVRMEMFRFMLAPPEILINTFSEMNQYRAQVDSPFFTHLLLYLCHDRQGRNRSKHMDIENLMHVIKTDLDKEKKETSFNLLGYCLMQEGRFVEAYVCFKKSSCIRPHGKACIFWMAILFHKVYNMLRLRHGIT